MESYYHAIFRFYVRSTSIFTIFILLSQAGGVAARQLAYRSSLRYSW